MPLGIDSFHGLFVPLTHPPYEVRFTRALPARHLPSAGFGHPLDGLRPRAACRPYFVPTAPMGFTLRSLLLIEGRAGITADAGPACRYRQGSANADRNPRRLRALKLGYRVLPSASPLRHERVFSPSDHRLLPWVSPLSGSSLARLGRHFGPPPLTRLSIALVALGDGACAAESRSTSELARPFPAGHPS